MEISDSELCSDAGGWRQRQRRLCNLCQDREMIVPRGGGLYSGIEFCDMGFRDCESFQ